MAGQAASLRDYLVKISAQMDGMENAIKTLKQVDTATQQATQSTKSHSNAVSQLGRSTVATTKQLLKAIIGYKTLATVVVQAGRKLRNLIKNSIQLNDNLEQTAKKLNMTTEKARAHQIALDVMGKTIQEINQNAELKKTYDDLVKLGEGLALPEAAKGMTAIKDIKNSLNGLRVTLRYGLQWVYYYLQKYLETPFKNLRKWLSGENSELGEKIKKFAQIVASALATVYEFVQRLAKDIGHLWTGLKNIWNMLGSDGRKALLVIIGLLTVLLSKGGMVKLLIAAIASLLDDFFTFMEGGDSVLGDYWYTIIEVLIGVRNTIASVVNSILDAFSAIADFNIAGWKPFDGLKTDFRLGMVNSGAVIDMIKSSQNENKDTGYGGATGGGGQAGGEGAGRAAAQAAGESRTAEYNAMLAQGGGAANYDTTNKVNSDNTITNNYNINTTINAQSAADGAGAWKDSIESTAHDLSAATA